MKDLAGKLVKEPKKEEINKDESNSKNDDTS